PKNTRIPHAAVAGRGTCCPLSLRPARREPGRAGAARRWDIGTHECGASRPCPGKSRPTSMNDYEDMPRPQTEFPDVDAPARSGDWTQIPGSTTSDGRASTSLAQDVDVMGPLFGGRFDEQPGCFPGSGLRPATIGGDATAPPDLQAQIDRAKQMG